MATENDAPRLLSNREIQAEIDAEQLVMRLAAAFGLTAGPFLTAVLIEWTNLAPVFSMLAGVAAAVLVAVFVVATTRALHWPAAKNDPPPRAHMGSGAAGLDGSGAGKNAQRKRQHKKWRASVSAETLRSVARRRRLLGGSISLAAGTPSWAARPVVTVVEQVYHDRLRV